MKHWLIILFFIPVAAKAQTVPDFTMTDTDGNQWNLYTELGLGKTVVLDFFFVNCVPCQGWTPQLAQLYADYGVDTGQVLVLGISDRDDDARVEQFEQTLGVNYPSGGIEGGGDTITELYASWFPFFSWPTYAVVCSDTTITWNITPTSGLPGLREAIDSCPQVQAGIVPINEENSLAVFPIPAIDGLTIDLPQPGKTILKLYDLSGREIWSDFFNSSRGKINVSLPAIKQGNYLLTTQINNQLYHNRILILNP